MTYYQAEKELLNLLVELNEMCANNACVDQQLWRKKVDRLMCLQRLLTTCTKNGIWTHQQLQALLSQHLN
ncbi:MAG: hypothetical protein U0V74_07800 [Chitinophagales bacterium]